jgi:hypothetical protein
MDFNELTTTKKGTLGEMICKNHFEDKGLVVMIPVTEAAHAFDMMVWEGKTNPIIVDIKTKASRLHYPDTGFDTPDFEKYLEVSEKHNMRVVIFFVDEVRKEIYYAPLDKLVEPVTIVHKGKELHYPFEKWGITFFPLESMKKLCDLTDEQVKELKELTNSNYNYAA